MAAREIIPAHDERVQIEILIPNKDKRKKPLKFTAPRFEFIEKDKAQAWSDWLDEIVKPVINEETGEEEMAVVPSEQMFLDYWIQHLDIPDADALMNLTRGEKKQIWSIWQEESLATLGESEPSSND